MFWRYHIFILLIGVPTSRILSSSTFQADNGGVGSGRSFTETEEELVDRLVKKLSSGTQQDSNDNQSKQHRSQFAVFARGGGGDNDPEVNLQAQEPAGDAPTPGNSSSSSSPSSKKADVPGPAAAPGQTSALRHNPDQEDDSSSRLLSRDDTKFAIFVGAGLAAGFIGIMLAGVCYYKFRRSAKASSDTQYPAYGVTGPMKEKIPSPGDRKLAQSAQMYHYQHQKQQMIAMEKANGDMKHDASEDESEEDNIEGDYTVYECPGLAPTGEMEVKNPLFCGDESQSPPGGGHAHESRSTEESQEVSSDSQAHKNP